MTEHAIRTAGNDLPLASDSRRQLALPVPACVCPGSPHRIGIPAAVHVLLRPAPGSPRPVIDRVITRSDLSPGVVVIAEYHPGRGTLRHQVSVPAPAHWNQLAVLSDDVLARVLETFTKLAGDQGDSYMRLRVALAIEGA